MFTAYCLLFPKKINHRINEFPRMLRMYRVGRVIDDLEVTGAIDLLQSPGFLRGNEFVLFSAHNEGIVMNIVYSVNGIEAADGINLVLKTVQCLGVRIGQGIDDSRIHELFIGQGLFCK